MREQLRLEGPATIDGPLEVHAVRLLAGDGPARADVFDLPTQSPQRALRAGPDEDAGAGRWSADDPAGRRFVSVGVQLAGAGAVLEMTVERIDVRGRVDQAAGVVVHTRPPRVRQDRGPGELTDSATRTLRRSV